MGTPTTFTTLTRLGLEILEDPTPLRTPQTWYRNGERGNLHATASCWKYKGTWGGGITVELTAEKVATMKQCPDCTSLRSVVDGPTDVTLGTMHEVQAGLAAIADTTLDRRVGVYGNAVAAANRSRTLLEAISETGRDLVAGAYGAYLAELEAHERVLRAHAEVVRDSVISWAASMLMRARYSGKTAPPGVTETDLELYGTVGRQEVMLLKIFRQWAIHRRKSMQRAVEAAIAELADCRLTTPGQLLFALDTGIASGSNLAEAADGAWRREIHRRLVEQLIPQWEAVWNGLVTETSPGLIGIGSRLTRDDTEGLLAACAHRYTNDRKHIVVVAPLVVCRWLEIGEARWNSTPELCESEGGHVDEDILDVVAGLWEPRGQTSAYTTLQAAIDAARQLV